jgi:A/G-specific adenine glycosylase
MATSFSQIDLHPFRRALLAWYEAHARDLPWRRDRDPYRIWVSEIMLQQTRVAAVLEHYARFMKRFPSVQALAAAREQSVLALWSGLGYYHRARRMHQAAKVIVREQRGQFPSRREDWLKLPGIGRYTAAALASIAFGEPVSVVDGNVERVLARLHAPQLRTDSIWEEAQRLLDPEKPGEFNQAMMELGAAVCTPRAPQCLLCPVSKWCATRGEHASPVKIKRKRKQLCYGFAQERDFVLLVQRDSKQKRMAGMWELPQLEKPPESKPIARLRHSITDTDYDVLVFRADSSGVTDGRWLTPRQWQRIALTGLARKILRRLLASRVESQRLLSESKLKLGGRMPALETGISAPDFALATVEGKQLHLGDALKKGPVLLAFFKTSCPVCQYAFPFFERVYQSSDSKNVTLLGISQDPPKKTREFLKEYGVTFPVAIDDESNRYAVSNAYGLTNVPTSFLIAPNREIEVSSVGWSKRDIELINERLAQFASHAPKTLWRAGEDIHEFRAG